MSDFTPLGRMLHEEHIRTLALMNALDTRTTGGSGKRTIDPADPDDRQLLKEAVAAIDEEVNQHFGFEESVIFPIIADRGAGDTARLLTQEHAVTSPLGKRLSELVVGALKSGFDDPGWSEFRRGRARTGRPCDVSPPEGGNGDHSKAAFVLRLGDRSPTRRPIRGTSYGLEVWRFADAREPSTVGGEGGREV